MLRLDFQPIAANKAEELLGRFTHQTRERLIIDEPQIGTIDARTQQTELSIQIFRAYVRMLATAALQAIQPNELGAELVNTLCPFLSENGDDIDVGSIPSYGPSIPARRMLFLARGQFQRASLSYEQCFPEKDEVGMLEQTTRKISLQEPNRLLRLDHDKAANWSAMSQMDRLSRILIDEWGEKLQLLIYKRIPDIKSKPRSVLLSYAMLQPSDINRVLEDGRELSFKEQCYEFVGRERITASEALLLSVFDRTRTATKVAKLLQSNIQIQDAVTRIHQYP